MMCFTINGYILLLVVALKIASEFGLEKVVIQALLERDSPSIVTITEQGCFMRVDGCKGDA